MGCCGGDREKGPASREQKWSYLSLDDFTSKSCLAPFSYIWLWILIITAIGVIVADTFTAINLLAFNRWSSEVKPAIPFKVSKWIFAVCIIISFVLLLYEWIRAIRVMRGDGVADSYLDPIAIMVQSIRPGRGKGWKRFLVFTKLTKSKKGTDYIALFVYFQFKGVFLLLLAEGPRQVVNALTLYSVLRLKLLPDGKNAGKDGDSGFTQFWKNVGVLADKDAKQAVILSSMLFTLVIWVFSAILLLAAVVFYLLFLWHYIPNQDGSLSRYCRRKIEERLAVIVDNTTRKAIDREEAQRRKTERKALKDGEMLAKPTLPDFDDKASVTTMDTFASKPTLSRTDTSFTDGPSPSLSRAPTLPDLTAMSGRPPPLRTATQSSVSSFASNAPLMANSGTMGYVDDYSPSPYAQTPTSDRDYFNASPADFRPGPPSRAMTGSLPRGFQVASSSPGGYHLTKVAQAQASMRSSPASMRDGPMSGPPSLRRVDTSGTTASNISRSNVGSPAPISPFNDPRSHTPSESVGPSYEMNPVRTSPPGGVPSSDNSQYPAKRSGPSPGPGAGFAKPPPRMTPDRTLTASPAAVGTPSGDSGTYQAFNPALHSGPGHAVSGSQSSDEFGPPASLPPRSNTAQGFGSRQPQRNATGSEVPRLADAPTGRSATAGPGLRPGYGAGGAF